MKHKSLQYTKVIKTSYYLPFNTNHTTREIEKYYVTCAETHTLALGLLSFCLASLSFQSYTHIQEEKNRYTVVLYNNTT